MEAYKLPDEDNNNKIYRINDLNTTEEKPQNKYFDVEEIEGVGITKVTVKVQSATIDKAMPFQEFVFELINSGKKRLIIDLTKCEFVDSTFMGAMVLSLKKMMSISGELYLLTNETILTSTFILTGLDRVFNTYPDLDTALSKLDY